MNGTVITVMAGLVFCYALLARRLAFANLTAPMLSIVAGLVFFAVSAVDIYADFVHAMAEMTLVIILFHDASTVRVGQLRHDPGIAVRLLAVGFPLALLMTALVTGSLLPAVGAAGAWVIAAAITPTDAGLGAQTVLNPVVPPRVRRGLNVESGLNDGLATPVVLIALEVLAEQENAAIPAMLGIGVKSVLLAIGLAIALALVAAWCMDRSRERHLNGHRGRQIATLFLPALMFGVSEMIGANAFIAAFVGGLVFGAASQTLAAQHETADLLETAADLLGFGVWFLFGGLLLVVFEDGLKWQWLVVAALALTALRVIPVALAMVGAGFRWRTVAFLGWFGPRGLATIVFGLLALEELSSKSPVMDDVGGVLSVTVLLSVSRTGFPRVRCRGPTAGGWSKPTPRSGSKPRWNRCLRVAGSGAESLRPGVCGAVRAQILMFVLADEVDQDPSDLRRIEQG